MAKKVAVVLSGCGVFDGSEIYETTLTLLHLSKAGAEVTCLAPNVLQTDVVDHTKGVTTIEKRNVLVESARLARGEIQDITAVDPTTYDAIIFPGGFGAAKNLSNFAFVEKVEDITVEPSVQAFVQKGFEAGIPFGFMCIAPVAVAAVALKGKGLTFTIGQDVATAKKIEDLGHTHKKVDATDIVVDSQNKIVTTPAYMCGQSLAEVDAGIGKFVQQVLSF